MNRAQRAIVALAAVAPVLAVLFPPWLRTDGGGAGFAPLWRSLWWGCRPNVSFVALEFVAIAGVTAVTLLSRVVADESQCIV